jgi:hypothetical protein
LVALEELYPSFIGRTAAVKATDSGGPIDESDRRELRVDIAAIRTLIAAARDPSAQLFNSAAWA